MSRIAKKLSVGLGENGYDILIGNGLLEDAGKLLNSLGPWKGPIAVVTDENVWKAWGDSFAAWLSGSGLVFQSIVMPAGEGNKSMKGLIDLYDEFSRMKLTRNGLVVAFGG